MVVVRANGMQQSSRNIIIRSAAYETVRKRTVIPIQEMKKECMAILNQKKLRLVNDETSMRNPDYSLVIYLTADKVAQFRMVAQNRTVKEEAKK